MAEYELKIRFTADDDNDAKALAEEALNEMDSLQSYRHSSKGELFYSDGETRVP